MIGNEIADKIKKSPRSLPQNISETVVIETENKVFDREIQKRKIYLQERNRKLSVIQDYKKYDNATSTNNKSVRQYTNSTFQIKDKSLT